MVSCHILPHPATGTFFPLLACRSLTWPTSTRGGRGYENRTDHTGCHTQNGIRPNQLQLYLTMNMLVKVKAQKTSGSSACSPRVLRGSPARFLTPKGIPSKDEITHWKMMVIFHGKSRPKPRLDSFESRRFFFRFL